MNALQQASSRSAAADATSGAPLAASGVWRFLRIGGRALKAETMRRAQ